MSSKLHSILRTYWGYDSFRPLQEAIMQSVLEGNDTLALMPTGGGKSLCYQVPAMAKEGICLVISPLIALMKDQVEQLRRRNITAYAVFSGMSRKEVIQVFKVASSSNCKFLYVSPERLETALFKEYLPGLNISLIAVDEAHCISQWGYDFRPPYLRIADLRDELPGVPVLALTASATPTVQEDICAKLKVAGHAVGPDAFSGWNVFRQSFERPNLSYSVFNTESKINKIVEILSKVDGSAIVYCKSRRRTKDISELLSLHNNIDADFYHAGLTQEERNRKQESWINDNTRVIVCTNAFGMGIDKPGVRVVIHADTPDCLENYYQEAGRAGRDGKTAYAVLLYENHDPEELENNVAARFPGLEDIRTVYQAIANYLQIPAGSGEAVYYDFDLHDFTRKFNLKTPATLYALKVLEQENWLAFNEQVFLPSYIHFTINKNGLYHFENENPASAEIIKTLLRSYEGIFDQPAAISEKMLAGLLHLPAENIKQQLSQLHERGVIHYEPQKDKPQLLLLRNRIRVEELFINTVEYNKRKDIYLKRLRKMLDYVADETNCRSSTIADYFGDPDVKRCGVCDNCLRQKKQDVSKSDFTAIHTRVKELLREGPLQAKELLKKLSEIQPAKAWEVLDFLQAEQEIEMDGEGRVRLVREG